NAAARRAEPPTVLSVEGRIVSQIDGGGIDSSATLEVKSFGREFSGFQVRLPRGATLLPVDQPDYSAVETAAAADATEDQRMRKVVEVRLKSKTSAPVSVKLQTKQGNDAAREGTFELGGFEVIGAVRQSGVLAVQVKGDWQVAFAARHARRRRGGGLLLLRPALLAAGARFGPANAHLRRADLRGASGAASFT